MADEPRCRAVQSIVEHDPCCAIYTPRRVCDCVPNISLVPFDGDGSIFVIDERGVAHRTSRQ